MRLLRNFSNIVRLPEFKTFVIRNKLPKFFGTQNKDKSDIKNTIKNNENDKSINDPIFKDQENQKFPNQGMKDNKTKQDFSGSIKSEMKEKSQQIYNKGKQIKDDSSRKEREKAKDIIDKTRGLYEDVVNQLPQDKSTENESKSGISNPNDDIRKAREKIDEQNTSNYRPSEENKNEKQNLTEKFTNKVWETAEDISSKAKEKAGQFTEKIREKAEDLKEKAKDKTEEIKKQVFEKKENIQKGASDKTHEFKEKAKDKAENLSSEFKEKAKDKAEDLSSKMKEKTEDMKNQAYEKAGKMSQEAKEKTQEYKDKAEDILRQSTSTESETSKKTSSSTDHGYSSIGTNLSSIFSSAVEDLKARDTPVDELVISDHKDLRSILDKYESSSGEEASKWLRQFIFELARHSHAEELILYPFFEKYVPRGHEYWTKCLNDHRAVKALLSELDTSIRGNPKKDVKDLVLRIWHELSKHIELEEKEIFPLLTKAVSKEDRIKAGNQFRRRKLIVPTRPHPSAPDSSPTIEALVGLLIAPADKFKDIFYGAFPDHKEVSKIKQEHKQKL